MILLLLNLKNHWSILQKSNHSVSQTRPSVSHMEWNVLPPDGVSRTNSVPKSQMPSMKLPSVSLKRNNVKIFILIIKVNCPTKCCALVIKRVAATLVLVILVVHWPVKLKKMDHMFCMVLHHGVLAVVIHFILVSIQGSLLLWTGSKERVIRIRPSQARSADPWPAKSLKSDQSKNFRSG